MSSIPVYFDIKDVAASGQVVIGCLYLGFMGGHCIYNTRVRDWNSCNIPDP